MDYIKEFYNSRDLYEDFFDDYGSDQYRFWQSINIYPFLENMDDHEEDEEFFDKIYDEVVETLYNRCYKHQYVQNNIKLNMLYWYLLYDYEE